MILAYNFIGEKCSMVLENGETIMMASDFIS